MKTRAASMAGGSGKKNAKSLSERDYPLARGKRGTASREEVRSKSPTLSAPRQSQRPMERSSQKRAHTR